MGGCDGVVLETANQLVILLKQPVNKHPLLNNIVK